MPKPMIHDLSSRSIGETAGEAELGREGVCGLEPSTPRRGSLKEPGKGNGIHDPPVESSASSSISDQDNGEQDRDQDLEALSTVQSNSPPYSVFTLGQKRFIVFLAAWGGFFSPLSANIYFPALTTLTREYNVSSTLMNLTLTSYLIFQGLAPTIFGDFADTA